MIKDGNKNDVQNKEGSKERTSKLNEDLVHSKVSNNEKMGFGINSFFGMNFNLNKYLTIPGISKDEEKDEAGDEVVMNNLMHDIKEGFIQRRLPDGGFKVIKWNKSRFVNVHWSGWFVTLTGSNVRNKQITMAAMDPLLPWCFVLCVDCLVCSPRHYSWH